MKALLSKRLIIIALITIPNFLTQANNENSVDLVKAKEVQHTLLNEELNLVSANKEIEHVFRITMSKDNFKELSKIEGVEKDYLANCILTYNNDTLDLKELNLRGKSSMNFKRKSFSVKLNKKMEIVKNEEVYKLKKFNLISLSMDQNYYRNKVAIDLMSHLQLFDPFYTFSEVIINGETQGIYLMLQKPKNYAFKKEDANFMLRRDYANKIKKTYYQGDDSTFKSEYEKTFSSIYNEILEMQGQVFYEELSKVLDVEQYCTWMAFNFLIGNRDYTDEVFFFNKAEGDSVKFGIIPWDYDDIFYEYPHEGYVIRYLNFGDKLAFSSEDALDRKLIYDYYAYKKYLIVLENVIEKLSNELIKEVFETSYQELYPYFSKKDIIKATKVDKFGKTSLKNLELDMQNSYKWLIQKRETIEKTLNQ